MFRLRRAFDTDVVLQHRDLSQDWARSVNVLTNCADSISRNVVANIKIPRDQ